MPWFNRIFGAAPGLVLMLVSGACQPEAPPENLTSSATGSSSSDDHSGATTRANTGVDDTSGESTATTDGGPGQAIPIFSGEGFIDAFFADIGLYVVHEAGVQLISRNGEVPLEYQSPRTIESSAFDGEWLGIADETMLVVLTPQLDLTLEAPLDESCVSAVMVSDARFVCGLANGNFHTYEVMGGDLLGTSEPSIHDGEQMRRIPGTDDFVTVTARISPSDFHLYDASSDVVQYVNESPYHENISASRRYGLIGWPATHLVNHGGAMFEIRAGPGCATGILATMSECFVMDGELNTLPDEVSWYLDLREGLDGYLYALIDPDPGSPSNPPCRTQPCELQRIDVVAHTVVSNAFFTLDEEHDFAMLRPDPQNDGAAVIAGWNAPFSAASLETRKDFSVYYIPL